MSTLSNKTRITIVGAGMGGAMMATYLARRGCQVEVYERRGDMRREPIEKGKSINMTLAARGLKALEEVGLLDEVMRLTMPLKGRIVHELSNEVNYQPYGKNDDEVIHSVTRNGLNAILMNAAQSYPNVRFHFRMRCVRLDKENGALQFRNEETGELVDVESDLIIGADGAFSTIRQQMHRGIRANYQQDFLDWGYKELTIPPGPDGSFQMNEAGLHLWPRGNYMLMAMPNSDRSFTCTCILPFEGENSFASIRTEADVMALFKSQFSDVVPLLPNLAQEFLTNRSVEMITTYTAPWYYKDRIVLIGDACHAVVPFYGLGMNTAFEDCSVLDACLAQWNGDAERVFVEYQGLRKRNTDILANLSKQNFIELRDKVQSPVFLARKKVDIALNRIFPRHWVPLYTMMTHTTMPYSEALARHTRRNRIARLLGLDVALFTTAGLMVAGGFAKRLLARKRRPIAEVATSLREEIAQPAVVFADALPARAQEAAASEASLSISA
ncbi:MAG TPA: NAD(P)/FAD-dependent oxidoreductase [Blastocatellia bacterium]|nr:NAD(P)/FAD-dependent oxidoreductase [Blastocatellia bacterium]